MLEASSFAGRSGEFLYFLVFSATVIIFLARYCSVLFFGSALSFAMTYLWSRRNRHANMALFGFIGFPAAYLPWVYLGFSLLLHHSMVTDMMGLAAGHLYYFLYDVWPAVADSRGWWCRRPCKAPAPFYWVTGSGVPDSSDDPAELIDVEGLKRDDLEETRGILREQGRVAEGPDVGKLVADVAPDDSDEDEDEDEEDDGDRREDEEEGGGDHSDSESDDGYETGSQAGSEAEEEDEKELPELPSQAASASARAGGSESRAADASPAEAAAQASAASVASNGGAAATGQPGPQPVPRANREDWQAAGVAAGEVLGADGVSYADDEWG